MDIPHQFRSPQKISKQKLQYSRMSPLLGLNVRKTKNNYLKTFRPDQVFPTLAFKGVLLNRVPCVPAWSTCIHANVSNVCQNFIFACQHANKRANVTTCQRRANMPKTCQFSNCVPTNQKACQFFNRAPSVTAFE